MHSLRGRLFGTLLAIFISAWAAFGIYVCMQFREARIGVMDHGLDELANTVLLSMPSDIAHLSSGSNLSLKNGVPARLDNMARNVQVWSKARRDLVLRSASTISAPLKADFVDGFANVQIDGEDWRVYAISDSSNEVQVQVGRRTSELRDDLKTWLYYAIGASFLAVLLVGIALKLVVRWSLQPVVTVQTAITKRDALDLTPLPSAGLPCEVQPLVDSFNRLLERLEHTLQGERRFLTEAAHELRTPLAVLLTHAQVAQRARTLEEARPALDQLVRGVERSTRLSQQLLDSARLERQAEEQASIELADIVAVVTHEFEMMAAQKRQSITLDAEPGVIRGNVDELGILVRNLLDNALRYAGHGCRVAVRCARDGNTMRLEVLDDGPGVAEADRERIFDRFFRASGNSERGSGIGLALVKRIALSHGATITTGCGMEGRGFSICIVFAVLEEACPVKDEPTGSLDLRPVPTPP